MSLNNNILFMQFLLSVLTDNVKEWLRGRRL